ncbi:hypothetical protein ACVMVA_08920 [Stenotrophomonas forensis]
MDCHSVLRPAAQRLWPRQSIARMHTFQAVDAQPRQSGTDACEIRSFLAPTLVIADPNPWVRRELVRSVQPHLDGKALSEARSPAEVLMQIANPHCKVLVIDPCMPTVGQTDGMPLLRQICCLRRDLLILVLAQQPLRLLQDRALPAQVGHVYAKTVNPLWLCRFISQALRDESTGVTPLAQDAAR